MQSQSRRLYPGVPEHPAAEAPVPSDLVLLTQAAEARPWATVRYLRRLIAERRISSWKVGRRRLVSLAELDRLAATNYTPGGAA